MICHHCGSERTERSRYYGLVRRTYYCYDCTVDCYPEGCQ